MAGVEPLSMWLGILVKIAPYEMKRTTTKVRSIVSGLVRWGGPIFCIGIVILWADGLRNWRSRSFITNEKGIRLSNHSGLGNGLVLLKRAPDADPLNCGFEGCDFPRVPAKEVNYGLILPRWGIWWDDTYGLGPLGFVIVPLWLPLALTSMPTVLLWSRRRPRRAGLCEHCHYELRGNVSGVCPECGTPIPRTA